MNFYIRIGDLPPNGKSKIYQWNNKEHKSRDVVGEEAGVSAYNLEVTKKGKWLINFPENYTSTTNDTIEELFRAAKNDEKSIYILTGKEVGVGQDNEPLLSDVKILEKISYKTLLKNMEAVERLNED